MNNGSELLDRQAYCHIAVWLKYFVIVSLKNDSLVLSGVQGCTKMPWSLILAQPANLKILYLTVWLYFEKRRKELLNALKG